MRPPVTTEETQRLRDEILRDLQDVPLPAVPEHRWLPGEIPSGSAKAVLQEIADFQSRLTVFLSSAPQPHAYAFLAKAPSPRKLLTEIASTTDPDFRESLRAYVVDWLTIQQFQRFLNKALRQSLPLSQSEARSECATQA